MTGGMQPQKKTELDTITALSGSVTFGTTAVNISITLPTSTTADNWSVYAQSNSTNPTTKVTSSKSGDKLTANNVPYTQGQSFGVAVGFDQNGGPHKLKGSVSDAKPGTQSVPLS